MFVFPLVMGMLNKGQKEILQPKRAALFTPGPLNTTDRVKQTMLQDYGSRDPNFMKFLNQIRNQLLQLCNVQKGEYECILMQGSGTFSVEAAIGTAVGRENQKVLVLVNGSYGERAKKIMDYYNIPNIVIKFEEDQQVDNDKAIETLKENSDITHIFCIHSETTSGVINDVKKLGRMIKEHNSQIQFIVDAMSSFGVYQLDLKEDKIDYVVASSNKNLQGVPGFGFVLARNEVFTQTKGNSRSLSLDLFDQWQAMEKTGQFRFTPPTHVIRAFKEALDEYLEEGGCQKRFERYSKNQRFLTEEFSKLGFKTYLDKSIQGCIITTFLVPKDKNFNFKDLYSYLAERNIVLYPGKTTQIETFRIGSIGDHHAEDYSYLIKFTKEYLEINNIQIPVRYE
ncbi:Pyridoxal phosphate-dependent transferase [Pseudocohnilembus persalinus]|uniref:Pyridoxal phosphate-dependent transferase n=1 Tax=Pseudocohnilembus persalinus TaxID=266149 RepID=A0A0V0QC64_PSEPJ|nr:Pyridoxal phosphate-dependent transferase [Pseudocohnilembus persalinus]|eukprot:KRW99822.1 Pyridoxal phosphate-dependent transferase [Pseudocohnilembus persalinus]